MSIVNTIAEGGQTWVHRMRMLKQVVKVAFGSAICIGMCVFFLRMANLDTLIFQGTWYYNVAIFSGPFCDKISVNPKFWRRAAHQIFSNGRPKIPPAKVEKISKPYCDRFLMKSKENMIHAAWWSLASLSLFLLFFLKKGSKSREKKHLSGRKIVSSKALCLRLKAKGESSYIKIGNLPLVKGTETQHLLITGGTGSGKTNCLHHILPQIRRRKQKTIVVDTSGVFVEKYFRPDKDILLNPLDKRSTPWNPWIECTNSYDFEEIAECFIPKSLNENENYWRVAAQSVLSSLLKETKSISDLRHHLLYAPLSELANKLAGTKASAHIDLKTERTAGTIRSVAASFLLDDKVFFF